VRFALRRGSGHESTRLWPRQGYRIWNFPVLRRGRRLGFRHLWSSLGRRDAFVQRKLGCRGSNAIALGVPVLALDMYEHSYQRVEEIALQPGRSGSMLRATAAV
jgi:hypothetical protein